MQGIAAVKEVRNTVKAILADRAGITPLQCALFAALIVTSAVSIMSSLGTNLGTVLRAISN